ncbi:MAG TPA: MerR family transcriptional regulator [Firmicutes bacterium]|jgi:MerR family transcriptional regulator, aldehyde-responsive regulator|nr:MerR family transcriptional regulator [Bacillota bacterium]
MEYSIQEAAKKVSLKTYTLRYYEKAGILPPVERDTNGNRLFFDNDIEWINLIRCLRNTGMPISIIKDYVDLFLKGDETISSRRQIMFGQQQSIERKIAELQGYLEVIQSKVKHYDDLISNRQSEGNVSTKINCSK